MRRCDRCGAHVVDAVGSRQVSLFDVAPADHRATPEALAELRAGRILCPSCQRTPDMFAALAHVDEALTADAVAELE